MTSKVITCMLIGSLLSPPSYLSTSKTSVICNKTNPIAHKNNDLCSTDSIEKVIASLSGEIDSQKKLTADNKSFTMIAISNISEGLAEMAAKNPSKKEKISDYLEKLVSIASSPNTGPYGKSISKVCDYGFNGLYLTHLNITLGEYEQVTRNGKYFELNKRISTYLADKSMEDKQKHFRSYPQKKYKWPADQAALLYSLYLFDSNFRSNISKKPIESWTEYMDKFGTDKKTGLYYSEISGTKLGKIPRGCALSWTIKYISHFDNQRAADLWKNYKKRFYEDYVLFAGFREWPRGVNYGPNIDSGPITLGIGSAATAFGVAAAKCVGDYVAYSKLNTFIDVGYFVVALSGNDRLQELSSNILAKAIRFSSQIK